MVCAYTCLLRFTHVGSSSYIKFWNVCRYVYREPKRNVPNPTQTYIRSKQAHASMYYISRGGVTIFCLWFFPMSTMSLASCERWPTQTCPWSMELPHQNFLFKCKAALVCWRIARLRLAGSGGCSCQTSQSPIHCHKNLHSYQLSKGDPPLL